jgi:hypothetical protein
MRVNAEIGGGHCPSLGPSAARIVGEVSKAEDEVSPGEGGELCAQHRPYPRLGSRLSFPYFRSEGRWAGRGLLGIILAIELGQVGMQCCSIPGTRASTTLSSTRTPPPLPMSS